MVLHFSGSKTWFEAFGKTSCGPPDFWWNPRTVLGYIRMCIPILVLLGDFSVCLKMGDTPSYGQFNRDNDDIWQSIGIGSTLFSDKPFFWGSIPPIFGQPSAQLDSYFRHGATLGRWILRGAPDPGSSSSSSSKLSSICLAKVWNLGDHRKVSNLGPKKWSKMPFVRENNKTTVFQPMNPV